MFKTLQKSYKWICLIKIRYDIFVKVFTKVFKILQKSYKGKHPDKYSWNRLFSLHLYTKLGVSKFGNPATPKYSKIQRYFDIIATRLFSIGAFSDRDSFQYSIIKMMSKTIEIVCMYVYFTHFQIFKTFYRMFTIIILHLSGLNYWYQNLILFP